MSQPPADVSANGDGHLRPAQIRVMEAARELFATHGVSGTSLQMIADHLGVSKAAVYHQFRTKEEITYAVAEAPLRELEDALDRAEATESYEQAVCIVIDRLVDLAVRSRRAMTNLQGDPTMAQFLIDHPTLADLIDRQHRLFMGTDPTPESRVRTAMVSSALGSAVVHPTVADLDDDTLRDQLTDLAMEFLRIG